MAWNHNLFADLSGPHFLLLYVIVILGTLAWAAVTRSLVDPATPEPLPRIPQPPDPYEIAFLRGGENEVVRVVIFQLLQEGFLQMQNASRGNYAPGARIARAADAVETSALRPLERLVWAEFTKPHSVQEIFASTLSARIRSQCLPYEKGLLEQRLLTGDEAKGKGRRIRGFGLGIILAVGGYKLLAALANGHDNVWFLVGLAGIGTGLLCWAASVPRISTRGQAYLQQLNTAFRGLKGSREATGPAYPGQVDPLVLAVAVFGVGALAGTPHAAYSQVFAQSATSTSGGCGSGTSSGCGGGGGGGGGCGGCGSG